MPRARSPDRDKAFEMWKDSAGTKLLKDIAAELGYPDSRIRKWKAEDKWSSKVKGRFPKKQRGASFSKRRRTGKRGAPKGNKNAVGHGAPIGNKNAVTTGEFETI
ncbi:MAG: putative binding protein [Firmicutes bacterium]|nr:putative binding protein [Bacillota bacterium]